MKPVTRVWEEQYGITQPLEVDSWTHRLLNRYVVAALLNTFPHAATRVFSCSRGELARLLCAEREGGSYRVFRAMYEYQDPRRRGDLINRLLMQSPAAKAIRNRRIIAQRILERCLEARSAGSPVLVLAIGGGDGSLETEVIARAARKDVYFGVVDKDERAVEENRRVLREHGIEERGFVYSGAVVEDSDLTAVIEMARRRFGVPFDGVAITVCHGIAEYLDIGTDSNATLAGLLRTIHSCTCPDGMLVISQTDYHDRVKFLERGLSWYTRLRCKEELAAEVEKAGWQIAFCQHEPMRLVTMCLAGKPDGQRLRIDGAASLERPAIPSSVPSASPKEQAATADRGRIRSRRSQ